MAVAEGRNGKVQIRIVSSGSTADPVTVAELGEWSIGGMNRNMIDYTAFGDTYSKFKPGMMDPGTISFRGFHDGTDSNGQNNLITWMSSGTPIYASSSDGIPCGLRLWANDDTSFDSYGFWAQPSTAGGDARIYITGFETNTNKDGLEEISFDLKISGAAMEWTTAT